MSFDSLLAHGTAAKTQPVQPLKAARDNIPSPPGLPFIGNILDVQDEVPLHGLERLADIYGPIFKLNFPGGRERIFIASAELLHELSDETRFHKKANDGLSTLNTTANPHKGLFTAPSEEDMDWQVAHRTLLPAFGPLAIQGMFDEMHDISSQLVLKWARMGSEYRIPVTEDFTRLTLDTIALSAMGYRFNSFYQETMHPFVTAMNETLTASSERLKVQNIIKKLMPWDKTEARIAEDRKFMAKTAKGLVEQRRAHPSQKHDLLNAMINGVDPKTGQGMPDGLIGVNMITFLIAGHETTSGLLSFAFLNLLKNPETFFKAQQEVDRVVGNGKLTVHHLNDLKYINAVLQETLRLQPTAPTITRGMRSESTEDYVPLAGGKYAISKDDMCQCLLSKCQRDPYVYGDDANQFVPERMLDGEFERLPKGAWKPFGTGVRSCIGRAFAWQEALMVLALLLQTFNFRLDDQEYELKVKQNLSIKPEGFRMRASLRDGISATTLHNTLSAPGDMEISAAEIDDETDLVPENAKPMTILYGSNTGTCQSLAQKLSMEARRHGYHAMVADMDTGVGKLQKDQPTVVITASYEGLPPDNAGQFTAWLRSIADTSALDGVRFAVFGCGHKDWASTFQLIPKLVDELLEKHGGQRVADRGSSDASEGDIYSDFDKWVDTKLWSALGATVNAKPSAGPLLDIEMGTQDRSAYLRQDVKPGKVVSSSRLTAEGEPEKRHVEVELPQGMSYVAGDYLAVLPLNPKQSVDRVMKRFKLARDSTLTVKPGAATFLPTGVVITVTDLLNGFVELSLPITAKDLRACIDDCKDPAQKSALGIFADEDYFRDMTEERTSLIDLLEEYPAIELSFSSFLSMLPPLRPRLYSIASSPLKDPNRCTITYGVVNEAARSGHGQYIGVASNYLTQLKQGDEIQVSVRATNKFFHLPADTANTPIMMFCAGTGLAPFRGFCEERAIQIQAGNRKLAPALLFIGCRSSTKDRLYADEVDKWASAGAVDVRYAFSKEPEKSQGCKYIQDRMLMDKKEVRTFWDKQAQVFLCGGSAVSEQISIAARRLLKEGFDERGVEYTEEKAVQWFRARRNQRIVVDVFA